MVAAIKADPGSVAFAGGSAAGGFDHMKPLQVMKSAGFSDITKVKYIGVDGGADAITQTIGGHTQAMTGDMSEIVGFIKSCDVRVLAVLTEARVPGFEDIPTAREQGFDVVAVNCVVFMCQKASRTISSTLGPPNCKPWPTALNGKRP